MKRRILFLLLPAMLLTGCNKDELGGEPNTPERTDDRIRFEIGFAPDGTPETKTITVPDFKTTWEVGDAIGIFAVKQGDPLATEGNPIHNVKLTRQSNGTWSGDTYWPNEANRNDRLDFYAYYPYSDGVDPTNQTFSVKSDQSGDGYSKSDLLLSTAANQNYGNAVQLQFKHALSLVQVEVKREINVPHFDGDFTVTLTGAKPSAVLDWSGTDLTGTGTPTDIVMQKVAGMKYTYRALVPAQTLGADTKMSFVQTTSGKEIDMTYPGIASAALTAKGARKYSVTLGWGIDPDHTYTVGDVYPHTGPAVGIVYWLDPAGSGKHGKVVGLKENGGVAWASSYDTTSATDITNGQANMKTIHGLSANFSDYPAFAWVLSLNDANEDYSDANATGVWYLPAMDELQHLLCAAAGKAPETWSSGVPSFNPSWSQLDKDAFNDRLTAAGGTALGNNYYWSSSENNSNFARSVAFFNGVSDSAPKNYSYDNHRARCVLAF